MEKMQHLWTDGQTTTAGNWQLIVNTQQVHKPSNKWNLSDFSFSVANLYFHFCNFLTCIPIFPSIHQLSKNEGVLSPYHPQHAFFFLFLFFFTFLWQPSASKKMTKKPQIKTLMESNKCNSVGSMGGKEPCQVKRSSPLQKKTSFYALKNSQRKKKTWGLFFFFARGRCRAW